MNRAGYLVVFLLALSACDYRDEKAMINVNGGALGRPVGFAEVREKVFSKYCNECHSMRGPVLSEYLSARSGAESVRRAVFTEHRMPPPPAVLSSDAQAILKAWLDAGAPEGESDGKQPGPSPSASPAPEIPPGEVVKFSDVREQVLRRSCTQCHFSGNELGREPLDTADAVRASVGSVLGLAVLDQMPPEGQPRLTRAQKLLLSRWVIDGMQE